MEGEVGVEGEVVVVVVWGYVETGLRLTSLVVCLYMYLYVALALVLALALAFAVGGFEFGT